MCHPDIQAAMANGLIMKVVDFTGGQGGMDNMNAGDTCGHGTRIASIVLGISTLPKSAIVEKCQSHRLKHWEGQSYFLSFC